MAKEDTPHISSIINRRQIKHKPAKRISKDVFTIDTAITIAAILLIILIGVRTI